MDDVAQQQAELRDDATAVREYGTRFPETWAGLKFDGSRLVVLFTDPDAHRHAIAALVAHPDRVDVRAGQRSERDVFAIAALVRDRLESSGERWSAFGPVLDAVNVELHGNAEDVARDLHDRFGDAVRLRVGAHAYPFADPPAPARAIPAPQSTLQVAAEVVVVPDSSVVTAGRSVTGQVEITSTEPDDDLVFDTDQPLAGWLLARDEVVGIATGYRAGTGWRVRLAPGERTTIAFSAGTDSRDLSTGPTILPGRYQLVVTVPIHSLAGARLQDQQLVTGPIPIDIVAPDEANA